MAVAPIKIPITAVDKTKAAFSSVSRRLNMVRKALLNFKTGLISVAGAAGFGFLIKSSMQSIDTLGKTAQKLGVTTQALQKLRYASELAGVETRTVDMAVQRFTRRLAEAAKDTGEAKDALKELGINAKEFQRLPLDKQMIGLADAFAKVADEGQQVRLSFKLFDSEGVALLNTLKGGGDALRGMFVEAEKLGFILSTSAVRGVEQANDQFTRLMSVFKGVTDTIISAMAPALGELAKIVTETVVGKLKQANDSTEQFGKNMASAIILSAKAATNAIITFVNNVITQIDKLRKIAFDLENAFSFKATRKAFSETFDALQEKIKFFDDAAKGMSSNYAKGLNDIKKALAPLKDEQNQTTESFKKAREELKKLAEENRSLNGAVFVLRNLLQKLADQASDLGEEFKPLGKVVGDFNPIFDRLLGSLKNTNEEFEKGPPKVAIYNEQLGKLAEEAANIQKNLESAAVKGVKSLEDALVDLAMGTTSAKDAFKSMARSIISDLIRINIQRSITAPLAKKLSGIDLLGAIGLGASGGSSGGLSPASMINAVPPGMASGGPVKAGRPYIIGEKGPELMVPGSNGTIIPNNKLGGGGSVVVNQTINLSAGVSQTVRAEVMGMLPQIQEASKAAVLDARRRGGSFSAAFG